MWNPDHPTTVLRNAWCHVRLDEIRAAAQATILELEDGTRANLLALYESRGAPEPTFGATAIALCVCCAEVREGAGLGAATGELVSPSQEMNQEWQSLYARELERYRVWASEALVRRLTPAA